MSWDRATLALTLLAVDPVGLKGIVLRARSGPIRDAWLAHLSVLPTPQVKLHPSMGDDTLLGGIDLSQTLSSGKIVQKQGLLNAGGTAILTMAERSDPAFAARLSMSLDKHASQTLVCLDEGCEDEEQTASSLRDRLAFLIELDGPLNSIGAGPDTAQIRKAQQNLPSIAGVAEAITPLVSLCVQFGIESQRSSILALNAARASAALNDRMQITQADIETAAALVLAPRATRFPQTQEDPPEDMSPQPEQGSDDDIGPLDDRILDAVLTQLPENLLTRLRKSGPAGRGSGSGAKQKGNRRGRPKPSRAGRLSSRTRLDLISTLRAAAPWQTLRGGGFGDIRVRPSDFRIKQYEEKSDRLLIFAVDASGSAAIARLAEAKGAVELLLAEAYARRDHVSLIAFRSTSAETLLPPTRSLVQTKRRLASLPGGGGTPLALGMIEALATADRARRQGMTPTIILLTDGRANVALDGQADRSRAQADSETLATQIRLSGAESITLDVGRRPSTFLSDLAAKMDGHYLPLPRADAAKMSDAVNAALS